MSLFDKFELLAQSRRALASDGPPPVATPFDRVLSATRGVINGQEVLLAGTNNYLGLTFHPQVIEKAKTALEELGSGTTGSRMANGSYASHHALEAELAAAFGWSSAITRSKRSWRRLLVGHQPWFSQRDTKPMSASCLRSWVQASTC